MAIAATDLSLSVVVVTFGMVHSWRCSSITLSPINPDIIWERWPKSTSSNKTIVATMSSLFPSCWTNTVRRRSELALTYIPNWVKIDSQISSGRRLRWRSCWKARIMPLTRPLPYGIIYDRATFEFLSKLGRRSFGQQFFWCLDWEVLISASLLRRRFDSDWHDAA